MGHSVPAQMKADTKKRAVPEWKLPVFSNAAKSVYAASLPFIFCMALTSI